MSSSSSWCFGREGANQRGSENVPLVDDHAIVRAGLRRLLDALPGVLLTEATTNREAPVFARAELQALVLLGFNPPDGAEFGLLGQLLIERPPPVFWC